MNEYLIFLDDDDRLGSLYKVEDNGTIEVELSKDGVRKEYRMSMIEKDVCEWGMFVVQEWGLGHAYTFDQYHWMLLIAQ